MADAGSTTAKRVSIPDMVSLLAVAGIAWYAIVGLSYAIFYGSLRMTPSDVGLTYAAILTNSIGTALYALLVALTILGGMFILVTPYEWLQARRHAVPFQMDIRLFLRSVARGASISLLLLSFAVLPLTAAGAAQSVKDGSPVSAKLGPVDVLSIRANTANVEALSKAGENPAIDRLAGRTLLYLGQNGGTAVLYDSTSDDVLYLPTSEIVLVVRN
jgi:hypothetical protein